MGGERPYLFTAACVTLAQVSASCITAEPLSLRMELAVGEEDRGLISAPARVAAQRNKNCSGFHEVSLWECLTRGDGQADADRRRTDGQRRTGTME